MLCGAFSTGCTAQQLCITLYITVYMGSLYFTVYILCNYAALTTGTWRTLYRIMRSIASNTLCSGVSTASCSAGVMMVLTGVVADDRPRTMIFLR
jgi:hypothetical protein